MNLDKIFSGMADCFGIAALGLCAYDPHDPPNIYFSIGEAAAALIITLIIPQFLKPIYQFRLATRFIRLTHVYLIVFLGAACVLVATFLPNIGVPRGSILAYPVFWEMIGGILFFTTFGALAFALLQPAGTRRGTYPRFAQATADFLAHANKQDQADFSKDLLHNIDGIIRTADSFRYVQDRTAFFEFRYRKQIEDAGYASSLLQLVAEPQFCETLVERRPWDTAAMLYRISDLRLSSRAAENLVREIARQAVISPSSMMIREIGYKGFRAAPVLSQALFEDRFIGRHYQPLSGLEYGDMSEVDRNTIDRLSRALRSTLAVVLSNGDYWDDRSLSRMDDLLEWVARDTHRQVRADRDKYGLVIGIHFGLQHLIEDTSKHLDDLDRETYDELYIDVAAQLDFTVLDYLSETIVEVLYSFANDFEGHDDAFWSTAVDLVRAVFGRFSGERGGMDPLQQRVAIKFIEKVKENMAGYYPALTRVLLPVIGPYRDAPNENPNSALSIFRDAFYSELRRFPELYEKDSEKASDYLPKNVRYDAERAALVQIYRLGKEISTELHNLPIEPVSLAADAVRTKFDN